MTPSADAGIDTKGGAGPTPSAARKWGRRVVRAILTVGVTWFIAWQVGVGLDEARQLDAALPEPSFGLLTLSVVALLAGFFLSARLWGRMAAELGGMDPGAVASFRIWMAANLGRYVPGKLWQLAGLAALARREGASATVAGTAAVLGQTFALAGAAIVGIPALGRDGTEGLTGGAAALVGLGLVLLLVSVPGLLRWGLGVVFRVARIPAGELPEPDRTFGPRWLVAYLLNWVVYAFSFALFVRGLGFAEAIPALAAAFAAAYLLGYVAVFAPAGIGVREGFLIAFLRPEMGGAAVGVAVLARVWMTLVELVPAGGVALWEVFRSGAPGRARGREGGNGSRS